MKNFTIEITMQILLAAANYVVVLSNAQPGEYDELKEMDNLFYNDNYRLSEWMRSIDEKDYCKSNNIPGHWQYKYLKVQKKA